jgi:SAM-dependent methyltransferase
VKMALLSHASRARLDAINRAFNLGEASVDSAFILQSLHHFHRRAEVFRALGRVVRPGGRLFVAEPHHNLRRMRLIPQARRRFDCERIAGRLPGVRHFAAVLALTARRRDDGPR